MKLEVRRRRLALSRPLQAAHGTISEREIATVRVSGDGGPDGYGEAAPLPGYEPGGAKRVWEALDAYRGVLAAAGETPPGQLLERCRLLADEPAAIAAVDLALWDRAGRREGRPVAELLAAQPDRWVRVNATLSALDRTQAAEQAGAAARAGFSCVKLKVGVGDDAGRVAAVRAAAGPDVALRLDANGAWDVPGAVRAIEALAPAGLELVEEPCHGVRAMSEVRRRVTARVAIDETAAEPGALGARVADAVCLKIVRSGGISALLAAAALVRATGAEVYLASTLDGPLGVAAAVHAAAALASHGPLPPCGLATLGLFADAPDALPVNEGAIALPGGPGLGVDPLW
jgi:L-Ala-D/L-Glu epimerase / N-acetyl-D-glutamate racemase